MSDEKKETKEEEVVMEPLNEEELDEVTGASMGNIIPSKRKDINPNKQI